MDDDPLVTELAKMNAGADRELAALCRLEKAVVALALCLSLGTLAVVILLAQLVYWIAEIAKRP